MVFSTGVIGQPMPMDTILSGVDICADALSSGGDDVHRAIMTTDTKAVSYTHLSAVGVLCLCDYPKQSRFSGAVDTDESDFFSFVNAQADILKQRLFRVAFIYFISVY